MVRKREDIFAPLKNAEGKNSPVTVREAIERYERKLYKQVTGHSPLCKTTTAITQIKQSYASGIRLHYMKIALATNLTLAYSD